VFVVVDMKITACMLTRNEEKVLGKCLENIKPIVDEIVIVDGLSSDNTLKIARKYTDKIFQRKMGPKGFSGERNFCISKASNDWILTIDPDEIMEDDLIKKIKKMKEHTLKHAVYYFPRKTFFSDRFRLFPWSYPGFHARLFDRRKCKYVGIHHETLATRGKKKFIPYHIIHHTDHQFNKKSNKEKLDHKTKLFKQQMMSKDVEKEQYIKSRRTISGIPSVIRDFWFCTKAILIDLKPYKNPSLIPFYFVWAGRFIREGILKELKK
jgi:glycosyltransferase involved in cell wall biosynthesis